MYNTPQRINGTINTAHQHTVSSSFSPFLHSLTHSHSPTFTLSLTHPFSRPLQEHVKDAILYNKVMPKREDFSDYGDFLEATNRHMMGSPVMHKKSHSKVKSTWNSWFGKWWGWNLPSRVWRQSRVNRFSDFSFKESEIVFISKIKTNALFLLVALVKIVRNFILLDQKWKKLVRLMPGPVLQCGLAYSTNTMALQCHRVLRV